MSKEVSINVPRLGLTVTEVTFIEWLKAEGEQVSKGETICTVESDKAVMEIEAPADGALRQGAEAEAVIEVGAAVGAVIVA